MRWVQNTLIITIILFSTGLISSQNSSDNEEQETPKEEVINPEDINISLDKTIKIAKSGDKQRAIELMEECIQVFEEDYIFYYNLGVLYEYGEEGRFDGELNEAIAEYKNCLENNDEFIPALVNLGYLYHTMGYTEEAEKQYRKVISIYSKQKVSLFNLGVIQWNSGRFEEARTMFEDYTDYFPEDDRGWICLAITYENLGEIGYAIKSWKKAFTNASNSKWAEYSHKRLKEIRGY